MHICGLRSDGTPICWGADGYDLGQATPPEDARFTSIASGSVHTCGLGEDGETTCWGSDEALAGSGLLSPRDGQALSSISAGPY